MQTILDAAGIGIEIGKVALIEKSLFPIFLTLWGSQKKGNAGNEVNRVFGIIR